MKPNTSKHTSWQDLIIKMFVSSRPISWINTAFPFVVGYIATGGSIDLYFFITSFYFLVPYNFLIYIINDVFDYESDLKNPRKYSIEGGILPPSTHRFMISWVSIFNLVTSIYILLYGNFITNIAFGLIIFGAVFYSMPPLRLKEVPLVDSLTSSLHFVSPLIFALLLTNSLANNWIYVGIFLLWGLASHMFGAVQDIIVDRLAGIKSVATWLGAKKTVRLSLSLYLIVFLSSIYLGWPLVIVCLPLILYVLMVLPYINLSDSDAQLANKGWRKFIAINQLTGFVITILLVLSQLQK